MYDVFIVGGGAAGMSCALVLGSAKSKPFALDKRIAIAVHQKTSHLQNALFNNVLGLPPGTLGADILKSGKLQLDNLYPHVDQIDNEKVLSVLKDSSGYVITTNKRKYESKVVVIAVGYTNLLSIKGLEMYVDSHPKAALEKSRIWLKNEESCTNNRYHGSGWSLSCRFAA